jgi:hypothetical protein
MDITFSAGQTEIKKIGYSGIRYSLTLPQKARQLLYNTVYFLLFLCLCCIVWMVVSHLLPNLIKFEVPLSLCVFVQKSYI